MATTSTPPSSPSPPSPASADPQILTTTTTTATPQKKKKPQPIPWTHQETTHLIQAYQEKWYSLKKGPLKSSQWEEVSVTIAARCGYEEPSKSATQCRHKMEKLRKRYRAEMQLRRPSAWPFFDLMDRLTLGPLPISAQPMTTIKYRQNTPQHMEEEEDKDANNINDYEDEEEDDSEDDRYNNKSKSINYILRTPTIVNRKLNEVAAAAGGGGGGIGDIPKRNEPGYMAVAVEMEDVMEGGKRMLSGLAAEIRTFAEGFVKMENVKMEMMREVEKYRMEMENKRTEMILDSQRKIVDAIGKALGGSNKKLKITTTTTTTTNQHV